MINLPPLSQTINNTALKRMIFTVLMLFVCVSANAATGNIFDNVIVKYQSAVQGWATVIVQYASYIFWSLALISMVWTFGMMALKGAGLQDLLAETIRYFVVTGFFWWLLTNAPQIGHAIIATMQQLGGRATGNTDFNPDSILKIGFDIFWRILDALTWTAIVQSLVAVAMGLGILIVLAVVGLNLVLTLISGWILIYGGIIFLGFGGGRWTSDMAIGFYKAVLGVGAQLLGMSLLVGIGKTFIDGYAAELAKGSPLDLHELSVVLIACVVLMYLVNKVPPMLASLAGGSVASGIGNMGVSEAAKLASSAADVAKAGASLATAGLAGAASMAAGGASAIKAAFEGAQDNMANGTGMFSGSNLESGSGSNSGGSGSGSGVSKGGSGGFMQAMASGAKFAADMGNNLAQAVGTVAKEKAGSMTDAAKERVSQSIGGQIANEIKNPGSTAQARQDSKDIAQAAELQKMQVADEARDFVSGGSSSGADSGFAGDSLGAGGATSSSKFSDFMNGKTGS